MLPQTAGYFIANVFRLDVYIELPILYVKRMVLYAIFVDCIV